ncbi:MAG: hypothetical protein CPSOU_1809 [uncultured Paraburkholderia sp.]|nr:MAG: hypothetical protein CPSOU_1809 [uncultured Paraburkholderia sp.]
MVKRYGTSCAEREGGLFVKAADYEALEAALRKIAAIEDKMVGGDWDEIEEAWAIAREALGETK